jgi:hypothetical protein
MSTRFVIAVLAFLSLIAAAVLLWTGGAADAGDHAGTAAKRAPAAAPRADPIQAPLASAPVAPAASAPVVPPPAARASDPFKAFLEAAKNKPAASGAQPPAVPGLTAAQDPFKAAIDARRRAEPVPLVSPFGAKN